MKENLGADATASGGAAAVNFSVATTGVRGPIQRIQKGKGDNSTKDCRSLNNQPNTIPMGRAGCRSCER